MNNAAVVGVLDRAGQHFKQFGRPVRRLRLASQALAQGTSLDQLHGEVILALLLDQLEDLHDVRVLQLSQRLGLGAGLRTTRGRSGSGAFSAPPSG